MVFYISMKTTMKQLSKPQDFGCDSNKSMPSLEWLPWVIAHSAVLAEVILGKQAVVLCRARRWRWPYNVPGEPHWEGCVMKLSRSYLCGLAAIKECES